MGNINIFGGLGEKLKSLVKGVTDDKKSRLLDTLQLDENENIEDVDEDLSDIPQSLKKFREEWKEKTRNIDDTLKDKIIEAAKNIPLSVETDSDGSRLITMTLGNKIFKILDPKLKTHSDYKYIQYHHPDDPSLYYSMRNDSGEVKLGGMWGDNVERWENQKLKEYVKEKQKQGLHIAKIEDIREILKELGKQANLSTRSDQLAMLIYLTGMDGAYRLTMGNDKKSGNQTSRSGLTCLADCRLFFDSDEDFCSANLCMISTKTLEKTRKEKAKVKKICEKKNKKSN